MPYVKPNKGPHPVPPLKDNTSKGSPYPVRRSQTEWTGNDGANIGCTSAYHGFGYPLDKTGFRKSVGTAPDVNAFFGRKRK